MEATIPLDLNEYRALVHLDEPFQPPDPAPEAEAERARLVNDLLAHLQSERGRIDVPKSYTEKRRLLQGLLTAREPHPLPAWFHTRLDRLLQREAQERGVTDAMNLPRVAQTMPESPCDAAAHYALWCGDITTLKVDAIVNAADAQLLGCFQPFHACIDNVIHSAAGPRLREDCDAIMQRQGGPEGTGWAKVTRAYNLPARYVLHTVGPIIRRGGPVLPEPEHEQKLADCYRSCLDLARRVADIRSIAFCCISTGVFGFPQMPAAQVALRTVEQWLVSHPDALDLIVFDVYRRVVLEIYAGLLRGD